MFTQEQWDEYSNKVDIENKDIKDHNDYIKMSILGGEDDSIYKVQYRSIFKSIKRKEIEKTFVGCLEYIKNKK